MKHLLLILMFLFSLAPTFAQVDSLAAKSDTSLYVKGIIDTTIKRIDTAQKKHKPRVAAIRSAIIPGWGQIYNGKIWKVPIVYTAVGVPAYLFFYNKKWYNKTKYAYAVSLANNPSPDSLARVDQKLQYFVTNRQSAALVSYRNEFRRNMDYSILFVLLFWSLNIVDATVDAHLRYFDVSPDLSMKFKPVLNNNQYGVGLVLTFK